LFFVIIKFSHLTYSHGHEKDSKKPQINLFQIYIGYLDQGLLFRDAKVLALNHIKSFQFKLDLLSIFPFELIFFFVANFRAELRLNRLLRINRLFECRLKIETQSSFPFLFRIIYLVFIIIVIIHWNGCFYYLISKTIGFGETMWVFTSANRTNDPSNENELFYSYVSSFFWSVQMLTTIGEVRNSTTTFEHFIMILNFLVAIVLIATLVGNIGSVISNMNVENRRFQQKVDAIKSLMSLRKVTRELEQRVIRWFDYLQQNNQTLDEIEVLKNLPEKLRTEISSHIHYETLKSIHIFSDCEESLLRELVTRLKAQVYSPDEFVCKKGEIGKELFIVKNGSLNVVSDDGQKVFVTLKAGSFFGELSILNIPGNKSGNRRSANVKSVGYTELYKLTKNDLWEVLCDYSENKNQIISKGVAKLLKDNLLEEEYIKRYSNESGEVKINNELYDFRSLKPEAKFEQLEASHENLEKKIETFLSEFDEKFAELKLRVNSVKLLYKNRVGISV